MTDPCLPFQELLSLLEATESDARWTHARGCPRCRSRLAAYRRFAALQEDEAQSEEVDPAARRREDLAVDRLNAAIRNHTLSQEVDSGLPAGRRVADRTAFRFGQRFPTLFAGRVRSILTLSRLIPALGVAAILVGTLLLVRDQSPWPAEPGPMRDESQPGSIATIETLGERRLADGSIEFLWRPIPGEHAYRIRLLDQGLEEVARVAVTAESSAVLPATDPALRSGRVAWWQVEALDAGDRVADSIPRPLP